MNETTIVSSEDRHKQVLIVLCGLVGSGKSTFATALQREYPEFRRCNQDELGKRGDVERAVHAALSKGSSVCVDRTNIDLGQRRTWIEIARRYADIEIWGIQLDTPYEVCNERLLERTNHPTLKTPEQAVQVLSRFAQDLIPIDVSEGFNRVYRLPAHHSPDFTREELEDILESIRATPFHESTALPIASHPSSSRGFHSHRGRGQNRTGDQYRNQNWRPTNSASASSYSSSATDSQTNANRRGGWRAASDRGTSDRRPYRGTRWRGRGAQSHHGYQTSAREGSTEGHSGPPRSRNWSRITDTPKSIAAPSTAPDDDVAGLPATSSRG